MKTKMLRSAILTNLLLCFIILAYTIAASPDNQIIRVNPFKVLDNLVFDYDMKSTMTHMPHEDIIVVAIDDATVEALGRFPFSREFYIPFLDQVALAKAVAFELLRANKNSSIGCNGRGKSWSEPIRRRRKRLRKMPSFAF